MSPIVTGTVSAPGFARSWAAMGGDSSMPCTSTPRSLSASDPTRADRELEGAAITGERPEEVDHRAQHLGCVHRRVRRVVDLGDVLLPHDRAHGG